MAIGSSKRGGKKKYKYFIIKFFYCDERRYIKSNCFKIREDMKRFKEFRGKGVVVLGVDEDEVEVLAITKGKGFN